MSKIIAIDFDGTLCENDFPKIGKAKKSVIEKAKEEKKNGTTLILNTMREGKYLIAAIAWCGKYGLWFDFINDNAKERQELFGNNPRKIYADEYWDDHNVFISGVNTNKQTEDLINCF